MTPALTSHGTKPHLSLTGLVLHSPSSIIGTPFDVTEPRFEYPFPVAQPEPDCYQGSSFPAFSGHISSFISSPGPPAYASTTLSRHESVKAFSPTHPKLVSRDPPVPPSLAKKRRSMGISAPPPQLKPARARSPGVRTQKDERGTTSRAGSEERRPVLTRKATARVVVNVRPPSPDAIPTGDGRIPTTF